MKKILLTLLFAPIIANAEYKMFFENKGNIVIPEVVQEESANPETSSGYLSLVGESDITITA